MGLSKAETLDMIFADLLDLIAVDRIATQGWKEETDDENEFFELLTYR